MIRLILIVLGAIALALGILGVFLPLLPTTPLLLLAAALWMRSSERLYKRLLNHRYLGTYIRNFREHRAIPLRAKIYALTLLWGTLLYCIFSLFSDQHGVQLLLAGVLVGVSWHILSYRTLRKPKA